MTASFVVEDGSGLEDANSFCSVAFAEQYFEDYGAPTGWSGFSTEQKEDKLRTGTQFIDLTFNWKGKKSVPLTQALSWPRAEVTVDGTLLSSTELPYKLQAACCEATKEAVTGSLFVNPTASSVGLKITTTKVGPITVSKEWSGGQSSAPVFPKIDVLLKPLTLSSNRIVRG